jgi:Tol biopolymer transport system component
VATRFLRDCVPPLVLRTPKTRRTALTRAVPAGAVVLAAGASIACSPDQLSRLSTAGKVEPSATAAGTAPTPTPRPAPSGLALAAPAASLPGRLLFVADANVWMLERGQLAAITTDRVSRQPSWSRDGRRIAIVKLWTSGSDLWSVDAEGKNGLELTDFTYREDARQNYALQPIWWPDGGRLLFLSQEGSQDTQLWQVSVADRRRQRFLAHGERYGGLDHPRLSPDGRSLAVTSFQPGRGPTGRPQVWTYALPNGPWRQLTEAAGGAYDPEWSPDGSRIAYVVRTPDPGRTTGRHDLWIMHADGAGARAITTSGANRAPVWSPDGGSIAFLSARSGTFEVWLVAVAPESSGAASSPGAPAPAASAPTARQITQGGGIDAQSGLAWAP